MSKDYYNTLGVNKTASDDEIKKAFRKKAHEYHPDKKTGDEAKFKEINEAYQTLSNKQKRSQYDQFGSDFANGQAGGGGFGGGGFSQGGVNINMDDLGDMFGGIGDMFGFGGGRGGQRSHAGADMQMIVEVSFTEAVFGIEKDLNFRKKVKCDHCNGNLAEPGSKIEDCKTCNGTGRVNKIQRTILGSVQVQALCDACQGEGKTYEKKCSKCSGIGTMMDNVKLKVKIPAGIDDGESIRLTGQGEAGEKGAPAGDLYLRIRVKNDSSFVRDGYDIRSEKEISFTDITLGAKMDIETVEGIVKLKIPAGTQSGTVFKIRAKGIVRLRQTGKGDHFVKINIKTPASLTRKQKELLKELNL